MIEYESESVNSFGCRIMPLVLAAQQQSSQEIIPVVRLKSKITQPYSYQTGTIREKSRYNVLSTILSIELHT